MARRTLPNPNRLHCYPVDRVGFLFMMYADLNAFTILSILMSGAIAYSYLQNTSK